MIRGALASRYGISPLGRGVIRPASGGWWLPSGVSAANCLVAYQAKNASDKATSLINLNDPGTNDLTEYGTVGWDSNGWKTFTATDYLMPLLNIPNSAKGTTTLAIRFIKTGQCFAYTSKDGQYTDMMGYFPSDFRMCWFGKYTVKTGTGVSNGAATIIVTAGDVYYNGNFIYSIGLTGTENENGKFVLGNYGSTTTGISAWESLCFYNVALTEDQVSELSTSMAAL